GADDVGARAEHLAELHEGGAEVGQGQADAPLGGALVEAGAGRGAGEGPCGGGVGGGGRGGGGGVCEGGEDHAQPVWRACGGGGGDGNEVHQRAVGAAAVGATRLMLP